MLGGLIGRLIGSGGRGSVGGIQAYVGADISDYEKKMRQADQTMKKTASSMSSEIDKGAKALSGGLGSLARAVGIGSAVVLAQQLGSVVAELNTVGAESQRMNAAFVEQWGERAPRAMETLRAASHGAISDMDLMLSANRAKMLHVTDDYNELGRLLEVATARGRAMGLTTQQAFNDLVTGIERISPVILANLGILTDGDATFEAYAASIGKTGKELTDIEKRQALVNKVLEESVTVTQDAAGANEALQAAKANLRMEIGLLVSDFVTETGAVEALTQKYDDWTEAMRNAREQRDAISSLRSQEPSRVEAERLLGLEAPTQQGTAGSYPEEVEDLAESYYTLADALERTFSAYESMSNGARNVTDLNPGGPISMDDLRQTPDWLRLGSDLAIQYARSVETLDSAYERLGQEEYNRRLQDLNSTYITLLAKVEQQIHGVAAGSEEYANAASMIAAEGWGAAGALDGTATAMRKVEAAAAGANRAVLSIKAIKEASIEAQIEMNRLANATWAAIQNEAGPYSGDEVSTAGRYTVYSDPFELTMAHRADFNAASLAAQREYGAASNSLAEQQFNDLRNIVESALSPTAVTAADLAATAAGTYVDKWDEYMRRVRMPESGLGADQIAEQERLFYSGQMLDQVNWAAIVSDVQRKVQEEAGREAMVQEAMRQVQMAGIGASQSQVAAALGITDYQAIGAEQGKMLSDGLRADGMAVKFTDEFETEFIEQEERWVSMGSLSVQWMAKGIEQGTTPAVVAKLVELLVPGVSDALTGGVRP